MKPLTPSDVKVTLNGSGIAPKTLERAGYERKGAPIQLTLELQLNLQEWGQRRSQRPKKGGRR